MSKFYRTSIFLILLALSSASLAQDFDAGSADPEISAGLGYMPSLFSVPQYPKFALYLALVLGHEHLLLPRNGRLMEMSRE